jgi:hypothetical protein
MKKVLPGGIEADITPNETGGYDVNIILPPKTYYSDEEYLKDKYDRVYNALIALKKMGIFSGEYNMPHIVASPVSGIENDKPEQKEQAPPKQQPKPKQGAKVEYSSSSPGYKWEPKSKGNEPSPTMVDPNGFTPEEGHTENNHEAPLLPPIMRVGEFLLRHPEIAAQIGNFQHHATNISTDAQRFAENSGFPKEGEAGDGTHWNAIRHSVWQATITSKFGESIAKEAGDAHEDNPNADLSKRKFVGKDYKEALAKADETIDLLNNIIGREIGNGHTGRSMREIAFAVLKYYHENGLYMAKKINDNESDIILVKLTDVEYNRALEIYNTLNENGFTPKQQRDADAERQKQNEEEEIRLKNRINPPDIIF